MDLVPLPRPATCLPPACRPAATTPFSNSHNTLKLHFPAEFPDFRGHNHMAKVLTPELYAELCPQSTERLRAG
ncbi:Creatine kinase B-type [Vulpes lagopus]